VSTVVIAVILGEPIAGLFDALFPAVLIIPLVVLLPAFTEELAWRGFALPRLMSVMSPLNAALVLAIPWTLIHVVLFLPGQWYENLALWPGMAVLDRVHPDRRSGAWPPLLTNGRVFAYEAAVHALFGVVLGALAPRD